jgi:hypothetical protein
VVFVGFGDTHIAIILALVDPAWYPEIHDGNRAVRGSIVTAVSCLSLF